jgi:hypothetical protein
LERLIFAEIGNRQAQGIDGDEFVWDVRLKDKDEIRSVEVAFELGVIGGGVLDQIEVDARAKGRRLQLLERNLFNIHVDLRGGRVGKEFPDDIVLAIRIENPVGQLAVEKLQGLREIVLDGVAVAAVVELGELREKVFGFRVLGLVFEVVVVDGLGAAQVVDADDEGAEVLKRANGAQIDERESDADEGEERQGDLEIRVRHHGVSVGFEVEALGIMKAPLVAQERHPVSRAAEEPPAVPLKIWLVRAGIFRSA